MKGITVILHELTEVSTNAFGESVKTEHDVAVENVLVSPASDQEILSATNLYGRKVVYTLGIPKGDTHNWENQKVTFFGETFRTFGIPTEGIDHLVPTAWNKKVMVERYE